MTPGKSFVVETDEVVQLQRDKDVYLDSTS